MRHSLARIRHLRLSGTVIDGSIDLPAWLTVEKPCTSIQIPRAESPRNSMAAQRRKNGSLDEWGQLLSLRRRVGPFSRSCRRARETFQPYPEAGPCPKGLPRAGQGARTRRRIDGNRQLRMEAQKLPRLWLKFEHWYFVPRRASRIVEQRSSANELGKAKSYALSFDFASSRRMHCLAIKAQFGLQPVQELLQGVCQSLGLISRRQGRGKRSLLDLGIGSGRDRGARSGGFHRHDGCPLRGLEASGSTIAPSPLPIVNYPACKDQEHQQDCEQGECVIVARGLLSR